jgi:Domain of unknown function (DUF3850)
MVIEKTYGEGKSRMHTLKVEYPYWHDVFEGRKLFEYRKNDRNYKVGDTLLLMAYYPETESTGGEIHVEVTYLIQGGKFGIPNDYCIMQFKIIAK